MKKKNEFIFMFANALFSCMLMSTRVMSAQIVTATAWAESRSTPPPPRI